jgi:multiple sugar transport system permease protein
VLPTILLIPLATVIVNFGLLDRPVALFVTYPASLVPFCTWLLIGYFKSIPCELEVSALIDGACRLQILRRTRYPYRAWHQAWPDRDGHFRLHSVAERIQDERPGGEPDRALSGDVDQRGSLIAGALLGSVPLGLFYSIFVEYDVSSLTGAAKE